MTSEGYIDHAVCAKMTASAGFNDRWLMSEQLQRIDDYTLIREVGRGATATVYEATSPKFPHPVALKLVRLDDKAKDDAKWDRRMLKLLRAEKAIAGRVNHPNIIRIFDAKIETKNAYVVMEFFAGHSLERYCSYENLLPVHRVISIVFKCAMALDYAYRQGIVHRDIKPANIMIDDHDNVKITDFGLALNVNKRMDADSTFIMGVGSPAYMSPEQVKGYPLNQKTDLYSLGVVLFHMLTGRLPFRAKHPAQLVYRIINADPPPVTQLNPDLPEMLDTIVRKALEKDLYSRYKNGAEFAKDLTAVRYKILDENANVPDTSRFGQLRRMQFFTEFDDIDIWELLRMCPWRQVQPLTTLIKEGDKDQRFGIVLEGELEISMGGRRIATLKPGDIFGESAHLDEIDHKQIATAVSTTQFTYLEINPSAISLASEETQERLRQRLMTDVVRKTQAAWNALASTGNAPLAMRGIHLPSGSLDLQLAED